MLLLLMMPPHAQRPALPRSQVKATATSVDWKATAEALDSKSPLEIMDHVGSAQQDSFAWPVQTRRRRAGLYG